jgi:mannose-1-phosphate guanylyltransferase
MAPIRGTPILQIWLDICHRAGIGEVLVNLHSHADIVRAAISTPSENLSVRFSDEPVLLGSAGTLLANRAWVESEPCFWVLYADVLTNTDLSRMLDFHKASRPVGTIGVYQVADPTRCGVVSFDERLRVREFAEKPRHPKSKWAFSGIMIASGELLDVIPRRFPVDLGFDVLPQLVGRMLAFPITDYLLDIGTMEKYQFAQSTWPGLPDRADVPEDARVSVPKADR